MEEWKDCILGDIAVAVKERIDTSVLDRESYISTENMLPDKAGVSVSSGVPSGNAIKFQVGDILISNIRPYFKKIWRANSIGGCSADVICLRATDEVESLFLYYLLSQNAFFDYVMLGAKGTKMPRGDRKQILQWPLLLPSMKEQKIISSFLKSLDDKIEVNKRINDSFTLSFLLLTCFVLWLLKLRNDNLQHQSNALFKSFFIDFEPFREGEFAETELGVIPKNWKILSFGDFIVALTEKAPVDSLPEYSVTNNGIIPRDTKFNKKLSKSSSMNKVLRKNNLVFGMSREILNWGIMEDEIGGVSSAYNIYIIDEDLVDPTYLRLYMKAKISEFNSLIGTAAREGQSLDKGQLMQKKIYVPTKDVLQDFFAHYVPIMESIHNADQESRHLAQLRDALLPKLMSGELKMNDLTL